MFISLAKSILNPGQASNDEGPSPYVRMLPFDANAEADLLEIVSIYAIQKYQILTNPNRRDKVMHEFVGNLLAPACKSLSYAGLKDPDIQIGDGNNEDLPPSAIDEGVTVGLTAGIVLFSSACSMCSSSSTDHRRYKGKFLGDRVHVRLDIDNDQFRVYLTERLQDAINCGVFAWTQGR